MNFLRSYWPYLCAFTLLVAAVVFIYAPLTPGFPYPYDSADYMYAGKQGFWANYTDSGSLSLTELLEKGTELVRHPERRAEFSREIRQRQDIGFYRHYHGPMFAYWIVLCRSLGAVTEVDFRNSGFVVHVLGSLFLMLAFWTLFPSWPRMGGLVAGGLMLWNRTALVTTVEITQHLMFLPLAILTLWALGMFAKTLDERWWYVTAVMIGLCFVAVETTVLLLATIFVMLLVLHRDIFRRWTTWRARIDLLLKGCGLALLTILVAWPAGVLKAGLPRGFVYLGYMALSRRTFSPRGALETWQVHFRNAPFEHWMLLAGFVLGVVLWKRMQYRREVLPWLVYAICYIVITTKITLEYTHYRGTISMVAIMITAAVVAHLWTRWNYAGRALMIVLVLAGLTGEAIRYRQYLVSREVPASQGVIDYVRTAVVPADKVLYVPYYFVPALHFYYPDLKTAGYDVDWSVERLVSELRAPGAAREFLCQADLCQVVARAAGMKEPSSRLVVKPREGQPLLAMETPR